MKKWADQGRTPLEFQPGDKLLIKLRSDQLRYRRDKDMRLERKYEGLCLILKKVGKASYKIDIPAWMKIHSMIHVSNLKPYHEDPTDPARNKPTRGQVKAN